jgi:hypothetical protein
MIYECLWGRHAFPCLLGRKPIIKFNDDAMDSSNSLCYCHVAQFASHIQSISCEFESHSWRVCQETDTNEYMIIA